MRKIVSAMALAAVLAAGSSSAFAADTGIPAVDALIDDLLADISASCAGVDGTKDADDCVRLLEIFAGLTTPEGFEELPGYVALVAADPTIAAQVEVATTSDAYVASFANTQVAVATEIEGANAGDPTFLAAIDDAVTAATGVEVAAGDEGPASPVTPGGA